MSPFPPKGSRALRIIVTEMAAAAEYGDVLTFTELAQAIEAEDDDAGHAQVRQVVSAARPLLLADLEDAVFGQKPRQKVIPGEVEKEN